jgi:hypothetical protein
MGLAAWVVAAAVGGRMPRQLVRYYTKGEGAAEMAWAAHGSMDRCKAELARHGVPERMRGGACARLHRRATGKWPSEKK